MENNEEKKSITVKQGIGDEAIDMTIQVTQEELDTMERIRKYSPENWKGKELELLQEARKIIKEKPVVSPMPQPETAETATIDIKEEPKRKNAGLWWTLGILAALFIAYQSFMYYVKQQTKDLERYVHQSAMSKTKEKLSYKDLTFEYPGNWSFTKTEVAEGVFMVGGTNEKKSNVITGYATSDKFSNVEYSAIYNTRINGLDALAAEYSYMCNGKHYFAQLIGFVSNGNTVVVNPVALSKESLSGEDFQMMENSISFSASY